MKKRLLGFFIALGMVSFACVVPCVAGDVSVGGYWRDTNHDGIKDSYVSPYHRTSPDRTERNNYNYPGNYNPNIGTITLGDPGRGDFGDHYRHNRSPLE